MHRDEQGADMVEYILIVAAVALPLLAVIIWFRKDLEEWFKSLWGTAKGDIGTVKALIVAGADVNASDHEGATPLMAAAFAGHAEVVRSLLHKGANVNAVDKDGHTALMCAAVAGHVKVVEVLLDAGADVNARDSKGRTALDHARKHKHREVVRLLRKHQAKQ